MSLAKKISLFCIGFISGCLFIIIALSATDKLKEPPSNPEGIFKFEYYEPETEMIVEANPLIISLTAYTSLEELTDDTPTITATGTKCGEGTLALSRDLIDRYTDGAPFSYGDRVELVQYYGEFIVCDTMNKRFKGRGDIWVPTLKEANSFGIRHGITIRKVNDG